MNIRPKLHRTNCALICLATILCFAFSVVAQTKPNYPNYTAHVNDFVNVLDANTKTQLENILTNFEQRTGAQIAVAIIPTLNERPLEEYANGLYRAWGIGAKSGANKDKGALLLLVTQDRRTRLEVGYGLEGDLPDGLAGELIRRMRPELQKQPPQYAAGVNIGVRTLVDTLAQKWNVDLDGLDRSFAYQPQVEPEISISPAKFIFGVIILLGFLFLLSRFSGRGGGGGGRGGGSGWWIAPMIFHQGGGGFGGSSWGGSGGWGSGGGGGGSWGGFGGGSSGGGGASDSW